MMSANGAFSQSDSIGAVASSLCVVHCLATPVLFVVQSCSVSGCCASGPGWWSSLDYLFIAVTFFAIYFSARSTSLSWIKYAFYLSWGMLSLLVINEKLAVVPISETWKYAAAFVLVGLHLYNRKYCVCADDGCCVDQTNGQSVRL